MDKACWLLTSHVLDTLCLWRWKRGGCGSQFGLLEQSASAIGHMWRTVMRNSSFSSFLFHVVCSSRVSHLWSSCFSSSRCPFYFFISRRWALTHPSLLIPLFLWPVLGFFFFSSRLDLFAHFFCTMKRKYHMFITLLLLYTFFFFFFSICLVFCLLYCKPSSQAFLSSCLVLLYFLLPRPPLLPPLCFCMISQYHLLYYNVLCAT